MNHHWCMPSRAGISARRLRRRSIHLRIRSRVDRHLVVRDRDRLGHVSTRGRLLHHNRCQMTTRGRNHLRTVGKLTSTHAWIRMHHVLHGLIEDLCRRRHGRLISYVPILYPRRRGRVVRGVRWRRTHVVVVVVVPVRMLVRLRMRLVRYLLRRVDLRYWMRPVLHMQRQLILVSARIDRWGLHRRSHWLSGAELLEGLSILHLWLSVLAIRWRHPRWRRTVRKLEASVLRWTWLPIMCDDMPFIVLLRFDHADGI